MPASLHDVLAEIALPPLAGEPTEADTNHRRDGLHPAHALIQERAPRAEDRADALEPAFTRAGPKPDDVEAMIAAAREDATALALAEARARFEAALDEARAEATAAHAAALAEARAAWATEEGARLAHLLAEGLAALEERISEAAARALAPLLARAARDKAIAEAADAVATLLRGEADLRLTMRGAADLGEAVLARLGERAPLVDFIAAETPDLVVSGADTTIETRFAAFTQRIAADPA